jgi:signal transduction histidine kinase/CheY-like chemotaxis protein
VTPQAPPSTSRLPQAPSYNASAAQRRLAKAVLFVSVGAFCVAVPFAKVQWPAVGAFIPAYQSALIVSDLATAALLLAQLASRPSRAWIVLASGYLFTAAAALAHLLSFPGLFAPGGLLGSGPQTTAWLYMFWHAGFPCFVIAHTVLEDRERAGVAAPGGAPARRWIVASLLGSVALAALCTLLATAGHALLPPIMAGNHYTPYMMAVVGTTWVASVFALVEVWRRRSRNAIDLWLMVVMCAWIFDIALSAVLNAGRFDVGFYVGRLYGLVAANVVLMMLVAENAKMHRVLARERDRAKAAEQAKGTFLATMSHEIRTPLNGVTGMLELLSLTRLDAEQRSILATVRQSGDSLMRIIDDILDLSKIEAGRLELRPEPVSVPALVRTVCDVYSGNASMKGLVLEAIVDERVHGAHVIDSLRVQQVLNNLVSNAIKFTSVGSVKVRVERVEAGSDEDTLRFDVTDTGEGLCAEEQARLFRPYAQSGAARAGSSGLGLSICLRLANLMGGTLEMQSAKGRGTTMLLTLRARRTPLEPNASAPAHAPLEAARPALPADAASIATGLVLVVDDHPINRMLLAKQLASLGHASLVAENGAEALELWSRGGIAVVVTDCDMPVMDGYELTKRLREAEAAGGLTRTPVIAWTANALEGESEKCLQGGMDDFLVKPTRRDELAAKLARWLAQSSAQAEAVDIAQLRELTGGDAAMERTVLAEFLRSSRDDAAELHAALASRDIARATRIAHRLKGAAASVGAHGLRRTCDEIESAGRAAEVAAASQAMPALDAELDRIHAQVGPDRPASRRGEP